MNSVSSSTFYYRFETGLKFYGGISEDLAQYFPKKLDAMEFIATRAQRAKRDVLEQLCVRPLPEHHSMVRRADSGPGRENNQRIRTILEIEI